jgi:hypothetical protein
MKIYSITLNLAEGEGEVEVKLNPTPALSDVTQTLTEKYPSWTSMVVVLTRPEYEREDYPC